MTTIAEIAWTAGIVEGEGCIICKEYAKKDGTSFKTVRLAIEMTDLDVLLRVQKILGPKATLRKRTPGCVVQNPHWRDRYILQIAGTPLIEWLFTIYPLLGERRRVAVRQAVALWMTMHQSTVRRLALVPEIRKLRQQGVSYTEIAKRLHIGRSSAHLSSMREVGSPYYQPKKRELTRKENAIPINTLTA